MIRLGGRSEWLRGPGAVFDDLDTATEQRGHICHLSVQVSHDRSLYVSCRSKGVGGDQHTDGVNIDVHGFPAAARIAVVAYIPAFATVATRSPGPCRAREALARGHPFRLLSSRTRLRRSRMQTLPPIAPLPVPGCTTLLRAPAKRRARCLPLWNGSAAGYR